MFAVGIGFVMAAALWLIRWSSRWWWDREAEMVLRRRAVAGVPRTTVMRIRPPDPWSPRARQQFGHAAVDLLRRQPVKAGAEAIDVAATLDRAIRSPGPAEPVPGQRLVTPEYLVLVDRVSLRDHQADWADALVDRLVADQVPTIRFEFAGDPRICYPRRESRPAWTLRDLAERYSDHRLLLFTDTEGMIDPRTGRLAAWVEMFAAWPVRMLLTILPPASWTAREDDLAEAGFLVEPATPDGLAALGSRIATQEAAGPADGDSKPVPPLPEPLRVEPERWIDQIPPPSEEVIRMVRDLHWYLKEDYTWLAACAIYPELRWDLTLELGRVLSAADGRPRVEASGLSRLIRLPWFRQGALPDWLRLWLRYDLPPERETVIRESLEQLLAGAERVVNTGLNTGPALTIAEAAGGDGALSALAQGIRRRLARDRDVGENMNDYIFATFLEGRAPSPLDFRLPTGVRALLAERTGAVAPGFRSRPGRSNRSWMQEKVHDKVQVTRPGGIREVMLEEVMRGVHKAIEGSDNSRQILEAVAKECQRMVSFDIFGVTVYSTDKEHARRLYTYPEGELPSSVRWWELTPFEQEFFETKQVLNIPDWKEWLERPEWQRYREEPDVRKMLELRLRSSVSYPVIIGNRVVARVGFGRKADKGKFGNQEEEALAQVPLDAAVRMALHYVEFDQQKFSQQLIWEIIKYPKSPERIAKIIVKAVAKQYEWDSVSLFRPDEQEGQLYLVEQHAARDSFLLPAGYHHPINQGVTGRVYRTGESLLVADVRAPKYEGVYRDGYPESRSELCAPVSVRGRVYWLLNAEDSRRNAFAKEEQATLEHILREVAMVLEHGLPVPGP